MEKWNEMLGITNKHDVELCHPNYKMCTEADIQKTIATANRHQIRLDRMMKNTLNKQEIRDLKSSKEKVLKFSNDVRQYIKKCTTCHKRRGAGICDEPCWITRVGRILNLYDTAQKAYDNMDKIRECGRPALCKTLELMIKSMANMSVSMTDLYGTHVEFVCSYCGSNQCICADVEVTVNDSKVYLHVAQDVLNQSVRLRDMFGTLSFGTLKLDTEFLESLQQRVAQRALQLVTIECNYTNRALCHCCKEKWKSDFVHKKFGIICKVCVGKNRDPGYFAKHYPEIKDHVSPKRWEKIFSNIK